MKTKALPSNFNPILDSLYYSIDQWMGAKHRIKGMRRSVCNGFIVERCYNRDRDVGLTDVLTNSLRIKLELYSYSPNDPDELKLVVLRFGHPRSQDPVVLSIDFSKYTKRKTIKDWVKRTLLSLVKELQGASSGFSTRASGDDLFT